MHINISLQKKKFSTIIPGIDLVGKYLTGKTGSFTPIMTAAGVISPLIELLRDATAKAQSNAAGALWNLASNNDQMILPMFVKFSKN